MVDPVRQAAPPPLPPPPPPPKQALAAAPYVAGWNPPAAPPASPAPAPAPTPAPEPQGFLDRLGSALGDGDIRSVASTLRSSIGDATEATRNGITTAVELTGQTVGGVADYARSHVTGDDFLSQGLRGAIGGVESNLRFSVGFAGGVLREGASLVGSVGQLGTTLVEAQISPQARLELTQNVVGAVRGAAGATGDYLTNVASNPSRLADDLGNGWNAASGFVGRTADRYAQAIREGRTETIGMDVGTVATYLVPVGGGPARAALGGGARTATESVVRGGTTLATRSADDLVSSVVRETPGLARSAANDTARLAANDAGPVLRRAVGDIGDGPQLRPAPQPLARPDLPPADLHARAQMAEHVYGRGDLPAGTRAVTDPTELGRLNLSSDMLNRGAFHAEVYATATANGTDAYTVAFRGSGGRAGDWVSNGLQGVGLPSNHYARALEIGRAIGRVDPAIDVSFVGHSLGGGLASHAANASGRHAYTFNAAGLHPLSQVDGWIAAAQNGRLPGSADNYYVPGEMLTTFQNTMPGIPRAFGDQHALLGAPPAGASWLAQHGPLAPVNRHMMDWVLASTSAAAR